MEQDTIGYILCFTGAFAIAFACWKCTPIRSAVVDE